jgi:hypothetical protein
MLGFETEFLPKMTGQRSGGLDAFFRVDFSRAGRVNRDYLILLQNM